MTLSDWIVLARAACPEWARPALVYGVVIREALTRVGRKWVGRKYCEFGLVDL